MDFLFIAIFLKFTDLKGLVDDPRHLAGAPGKLRGDDGLSIKVGVCEGIR